MSPFSIAVLAVSMSVDAFAVSVGRGAAIGRPPVREALRTGLVFGIVEALTPLIGWAAGFAASRYVEAVDHWIAFALLGALGVHMIVAGLRPEPEEAAEQATEDGGKHHRFWALAATGLATSIDAAAIGVSLAFLDVHIGVVALVIGLCTLVMVTLGVMLGRALGALVGKRAEIAGGVILILVGAGILYEHLYAVA